jgi:hypothetical protein
MPLAFGREGFLFAGLMLVCYYNLIVFYQECEGGKWPDDLAGNLADNVRTKVPNPPHLGKIK